MRKDCKKKVLSHFKVVLNDRQLITLDCSFLFGSNTYIFVCIVFSWCTTHTHTHYFACVVSPFLFTSRLNRCRSEKFASFSKWKTFCRISSNSISLIVFFRFVSVFLFDRNKYTQTKHDHKRAKQCQHFITFET